MTLTPWITLLEEIRDLLGGGSTPTVTAIRTTVTAATADTLLLAANADRTFASVYNDSTATLYLGLGTTAASLSDFSVRVPSQTLYEVPDAVSGVAIRGIWDAADGDAIVTAGVVS